MFKGADLIHSYSFKEIILTLAIESDSLWLIGGNRKLFTFNPNSFSDKKNCELTTVSDKINGYVYALFKTCRGDYAIGT